MLRQFIGSAIVRRAAVVSLLTVAVFTGGAGVASAQTIRQQVRTDDLAALRQIDVPAAWSRSRGSGVTVAVLDTGVRPGAPDLTGQVTVGPDYTVGANPPGYAPPHLHGTYIGSIIAGHGSGLGRAQGMIGVAPQARILSVRVIYPGITPAQVARALAESASYHPAGGYNTTVGFGLINPLGALHDAAALVKLGTSATPGAGTVRASARFGTSAPGVIEAVPEATAKLAGSGAAFVVGLMLLVVAAMLTRRRRRAAARLANAVLPMAGPATTGLPRADLPPLGPPARPAGVPRGRAGRRSSPRHGGG